MKSILLILVVIAVFWSCGELPLSDYPGAEDGDYAQPEAGEINESRYYRCLEVLDGQTIVVDIDGKRVRVRLLGVVAQTIDKGAESMAPDFRSDMGFGTPPPALDPEPVPDMQPPDMDMGPRPSMTPPTKDFDTRAGWHAETFLENLVRGRNVRLEYDFSDRSRSGGTSAFVFLRDGTFVNAEVLRQGLGRLDTRSLFKYHSELQLAIEEARDNRRGIWR